MTKSHCPAALRGWAVAFGAAVFLGACSSVPPSLDATDRNASTQAAASTTDQVGLLARGATKSEIESAVAAVAMRRWDLMLDRQFETAFTYLTEASKAGIQPDFLQDYVDRLGAKKAVVKKTSCGDTTCEVDFDLTIALKLPNIPPRLIDVPLKERWVVQNGSPKFIRPSAR